MPRPLPRRMKRVEGELVTGDLGGEVTWGVGSDGGGGAGGRGSPPESKFPPGEDEGVMKWQTLRTGIPYFQAFPLSVPRVQIPQ